MGNDSKYLKEYTKDCRQQAAKRIHILNRRVERVFEQEVVQSTPEKHFGFIPTYQIGYKAWVLPVYPGTQIFNILTGKVDTADRAHNIVISGTRGEQWIVSDMDLYDESKFRITVGTSMSFWVPVDVVPAKDKKMWAYPIPAGSEFVLTQADDTVAYGNHKGIDGIPGGNKIVLEHGCGDVIIAPTAHPLDQPRMFDLTVVNGEIFADTYSKRSSSLHSYAEYKMVETRPPKPMGIADSLDKAYKLYLNAHGKAAK